MGEDFDRCSQSKQVRKGARQVSTFELHRAEGASIALSLLTGKERCGKYWTMRMGPTVISSGQVTIPKDIRESIGAKSGDRIAFTLLSSGIVLLRAKNKSARNLRGSLRRKPRKAVSVGRLSRW